MTRDLVDQYLMENAEKSEKLGFDAYCTDCQSATFLNNGRCSCGSGRWTTVAYLRAILSLGEQEGRENG